MKGTQKQEQKRKPNLLLLPWRRGDQSGAPSEKEEVEREETEFWLMRWKWVKCKKVLFSTDRHRKGLSRVPTFKKTLSPPPSRLGD